MLHFLPSPLRGIIALILHLLNLLLIPSIVIIIALLRYLIPFAAVRRRITDFLHEIVPFWWTDISDFITWLVAKTEWDVRGTGELKRNGWYFVVSNHQSWLDILVLEKIFKRKIPMLKFFMKQELLWMLPIGGIACWIMGFPFVKRYSADYLTKHPEKRGQDLETTRRACEKFKHQPISVMSFLEGTRFSKRKHDLQMSPYQHLLKPKVGGFAFVLKALEGCLNEVIDVTIIYPEANTNLWKFICGDVKKIIVYYEVFSVDINQHSREQFQQWLNQRWQQKDQLINNILQNKI